MYIILITSMNASNEKALKVLEQQYEGFINTTGWNFFRGLADYVKTVQETIPTKHIVEALEKQQEMARKPYEIVSARAFKELSKSAEKIIQITENLSKEYERYKPVTQKIDEIKAQLAGTFRITSPLQNLDSNIMDVAIQIKALGYSDTIKQFEDEPKRIKNMYGDYVFSPTYEKIAIEEKKLERRKETEAWGAWAELPIVEKVILEPEELNKEARKDIEYLRERKGIKSCVIDEFEDIRVQEMDCIRASKIEGEKTIFFKLADYKDYARRIHIYITTELIKNDEENNLPSIKKEYEHNPKGIQFISYNDQTGTGQARKKFKLKLDQSEHKVFSELYKNINYKVSRESILVLIGHHKEGEIVNKPSKKSGTYAITSLVKALREKTGLNPDELVQNGGNLILMGNIPTN